MTGWLGPVAGAALVAVLELDTVQFGQFMLSRPLVLGPVLGLLFAAPGAGLALGLICELLSLDDVPVGARLPLNAAVAVAAAFLLTRGPRPLPAAAALPVGLAAGWLHQRVEGLLRQRRRVLCGEAERALREGSAPPWGWVLGRALAGQAAATFAVLLACVFLVGPALNAVWFRVPRALEAGFVLGWGLAPWLGLGVALHALRMRT
jgi:mannose/fructose/N-acetylgalactosamine-specific phosphotransferase system component IIC